PVLGPAPLVAPGFVPGTAAPLSAGVVVPGTAVAPPGPPDVTVTAIWNGIVAGARQTSSLHDWNWMVPCTNCGPVTGPAAAGTVTGAAVIRTRSFASGIAPAAPSWAAAMPALTAIAASAPTNERIMVPA